MINLSKSVPVGRQCSMDLSFLLVLQTETLMIFSKMFVEQIALQARESFSFWSRRQKLSVVQFNKHIVSLWSDVWTVYLQLIIKTWGFISKGLFIYDAHLLCAISKWESAKLLLLFVPRVIKTFLFDLWVWCLLTISMKL